MLKFQFLFNFGNVGTITVLLLFFCVSSLLNAATEYGIDDEDELFTVLKFTEDRVKIFNLEKDILVAKNKIFNIQAGDSVTFRLNAFNLTGTGNFEFHTIPAHDNAETNVTIIGSTAGFNGGLKIFDNINLLYDGTYISNDLDVLGKNPNDHVTVNFTNPGSGWNATATTPQFINEIPLPANLDDLALRHEGVIIVGGDGVGNLNVTNGNWVRNAATIVGARNQTEASNLLISGKGTRWYAVGSFYIGYQGIGVTNINEGAKISTGSIGLGIAEPAASGTLNVTGTGFKIPAPADFTNKSVTEEMIYDAAYRSIFKTNEKEPLDNTTTVFIFGRDDYDQNQIPQLQSRGKGVMNFTNGAHLVFDEYATETGKSSGYIPKLTLGIGNSIVDHSLVSGTLRNWYNNNSHTGVIDGSVTGNNSLTFQNGSVLEGTLTIKMQHNSFTTESIITPGYDSYEYPYINPRDKKFGHFDFSNTTLTLDDSIKTYIDFDVHGDSNAQSTYANHPIIPAPSQVQDPLKETIKGTQSSDYLPNHGRDVIKSNGMISLGGDIYFRPQAGYYSDHIDLNFIETDNQNNIVKQFDANRVHLEPVRWFENKRLVIRNDGNHLLLDRHQSPFSTAGKDFNSKSVGSSLDSIYNANDNYSWLHILDWVWFMNDKELQKTLHELSGEVKASSFYLPLRNQWRYGFERVNWSRTGNHVYFGTQNNADPKIAKNNVWVTPYYDYFHAGNDGNVTSTTTERVSFFAGYDRALMKTPYFAAFSKSAFGLLFGYSQPKLDQNQSRIIADDYLLGAHFNTRLYEKYELKLWGGLGAQQYHLNRYVPVPNVNGNLSSKYTGTTWSGSVQAARPFYYRNVFVLRPLAALDLMVVNQNSVTENGTYEQIILRYQRSKWSQLFGRAGVRADFASGRWNLNGSLSYSYLLLGDQAPVSTHQFVYAGGSPFDIQGNNLGRSFLNFGLGTQLHLDCLKTSVLFFQYNSDYSKHSNSQTTTIGYQKLF
ncbi:MAG: autotransporter outer membrane beta-barrel domain-containing protein [Planctomycetaceae bacterium]|jgi:T5SS/PEP-CTERM-associated repeat protein|nr:autotransporter outer membrane beta-barrel domain-containing protein [Planctomycetaceae bacterium]